MTGTSIPWKMTPEQLKQFIEYSKKPISAFLIMGGCALMMEHLFTFGGFDLLDFWGHEYVGMGLVAAGFFLSMKWEQWDSLDLHKFKNWWR